MKRRYASHAKRRLPVFSASPCSVAALRPRLRIVSIMPGIDIAEPDRTETSSGFSGRAEALAGFPLERRQMRPDSVHQPVRQPLVAQVGEAGRRRDDESRRNVEADLRHRAQVGAFAAEEHPVVAVAFLEAEDELLFAHGRPTVSGAGTQAALMIVNARTSSTPRFARGSVRRGGRSRGRSSAIDRGQAR